MIRRLLAAGPALMLLSALSVGCTEEAQARLEADQRKMKTQAAERMVKDRAEDYWIAVRWQNWSDASAFIEEPDDRLSFLHARTEGDPTFPTMDEIEIKYIFVDPATFAQAEIRTGWVEFLPPARRAENRQTTQSWYKHNGQWWLSAADAAKPLAASTEGSAP